jgi:hypothetical protein
MKRYILGLIPAIFLVGICFTSCNQSGKPREQDKESMVKENEQLQKENEILKKELEHKQSLSNQASENRPDGTDQKDPGSTGNLDFMKTLTGKYPYEVKLFDNPVLASRLKILLGDRFDFLKSIWETQTPVEINGDLFYAWAMKAHSGGDPGAVLMVDFSKDVVFAGIRENGEEMLYSEDGSDVPVRLREWADEQ